MWDKVTRIWKLRDLRNKILFVLALLIVFRFAAHIPIPGVDVGNLRNLFESNQFLGMLNLFTGGAMENFSIVMLGVGPYITASIIMQLLTSIVPKLEEMYKEPDGQKKINQWMRMLTVPLAAAQAYSTITLLQKSGQGVVGNMSIMQLVTAVVLITGGSMFLMWLGELITEKKVGNGVSLMIFAGIVARVPTSIQQTVATFDPSHLPLLIVFLAVAIITIVGIVFITEAQRNIPVSYARQIRGNRVYGGMTTHLPLRVNQAGVIPIIFAVSLVLLPSIAAQFVAASASGVVKDIAQQVVNLFNNQLFYGVTYFLLVFIFTYFYTAVIFHPDQIAENLQKQGGFIPGIRPGKTTAFYLKGVSNRILLAGALFLGSIAVLPLVLRGIGGNSFAAMAVGGTSLLIVVSVAIETVKQVEAQLTVRDYDNF
ncbi:MAG: preprotein translocase subunit SecY [Patescibacteria group bacterium]|jgi:preprotein translocase subunit SecY